MLVHRSIGKSRFGARHVCLAAAWALYRMGDGAEIYRPATPRRAFIHVEEGVGRSLCAYDAAGGKLENGYEIIHMNQGISHENHEPWQFEVEGGGWTWRWKMNF